MSKLRLFFMGRPRTEDAILKSFPSFFLITGSIIFWELFLHLVLFQSFSWRILYILAFSVFFGVLFTMMTGFCSRRWNLALFWLFMSLLYLWYAAQLIYYKIFGGFISVYLVGIGGEAVTNFFKETLSCILHNWYLLLILAAPLPVSGVLLHKKLVNTLRRRWGCITRQAIVCILLHLLCLWSLRIGGTGPYSIYDIYHNINTGTDTSVANLGFLTTFRLELKCILFGNGQDSTQVDDLVILDPGYLDSILGGNTEATESSDSPPGDASESTGPSAPVVTYYDQVLEIDFDALITQAQGEGNDTLATLHQYFASQSPTRTNEYTGLFAGKNLIYLVCESFSPVVISQEMTPTLYKLYNEGIRFTNFYGSFRNVTTNGEYTACLGVFPDMSRSKQSGSFSASSDNHLPFALGNIFREQLGISGYAYHNFLATYYNRDKSHPNMGYTLKAMHTGMEFSHSWPSSDYEMMQQSVADYVGQEQFLAYYMTFSGHYAYDFETNPICILNQDAVKDLNYSEAVRAYIACHLELEKAMAYLMEQLTLAGQLENTVIVMTSDHYPYGLTENQYSELAGETKDGAFGIYENAFICWSYGMENPIQIDTPCCTVDILPTLLNLFGLSYDSRLLIGRDVLDPNAQHIAILHNGSFITSKVMFNSTTGSITYLVDKESVADAYVDVVNQLVQNRFTVSKAILDYDYYRIVLPPDDKSE